MIHDLALRIAQQSAKHLSFDEVSGAIEALDALGYTFEPPGVPGRYIESDESRADMVRYLARTTKLHPQIARDVLGAIHGFGLRIREPDKHPSGLETKEPAITTVRKRAAFASELIFRCRTR